jgi:peptidoglycan/xylan/chitin deacetylase (PgdA/CDA1 family)
VGPRALGGMLAVAAMGWGSAGVGPGAPFPGLPPLPPFAETAWWEAAIQPQHAPPWQLWPARWASTQAGSVLVFVYHQVSPPRWPWRNGPDFITPGELARELRFFHVHHVPTLTAAQFVGFLHGRERVPPGSVFLTFDNGLEGVYRYAYPLLLRYQAHATVFLIGDRLHARWRPGDRYLGWDQVRRMLASGLVDVGSETYNLHARASTGPGTTGPTLLRHYQGGRWEPLSRYVHRLWKGLYLGRWVVAQNVHRWPTLLVWPFSTYNRLAQWLARAAGYQAALAVYPGVVVAGGAPDPYALPRNPATFPWNNVPWEYGWLEAAMRLPVRSIPLGLPHPHRFRKVHGPKARAPAGAVPFD